MQLIIMTLVIIYKNFNWVAESEIKDWVREISLAEKHFMAVIAQYGMI